MLTAPTTNDNYPLGGHYRFTYGADGALLSHRRFLNSCFAVPLQGGAAQLPDGGRATGIVVTHLLDDFPTEIHFFVSRNIPLAMIVGTINSGTMWTIQDGVMAGTAPLPN